MRRFVLSSLVAGGILWTALAQAAIADQWLEDLPVLPGARQEVGVAALNEKVYVIGGIPGGGGLATGRVDRFNVATGEWEVVPPLPDNAELHHMGAAVADGKLYTIGGLTESFAGVNTVFAFDPTTNLWLPGDSIASLPTPRGGMGVATLGDAIYAAGGQFGGTSFTDFAVFFPAENRWEELPPMPTARNHLAAVAHNGLFYAVGGRDGGILSGKLEVYDPGARMWNTLEPLLTPRAGITASVVFDEIFVFGGEGNTARPDGIFPQTESYSIELGCWYPRLDMAAPRHGIGSAVVEIGLVPHILIPGGSPVQGFGVTDVHDAFLPGTPPWESDIVFRRGESNRDGTLDLSDAVFTLFWLFIATSEIPCEDALDANDDGALDIADPIYTLEYLFTGGMPPPPPGPDLPGVDPTADKLTCEE